MSDQKRKYEFQWDLVGDINEGRPNLGPSLRVELYRMMQFSIRDVLEQRIGSEDTDRLFYDAGYLAAKVFYDTYLSGTTDLQTFVAHLQQLMRETGMGVLRVEKADMEAGELLLTVSEDLDCSGLPELDYEICHYDEGFIAALLERFSGVKFKVREIDCWCTGDRTCRFHAVAEI